VVTREVVGVQEKKDSATSLIADEGDMFLCCGSRKQERRASGIGRSYYDPALAASDVHVLDQREAKFFREKDNCFVVIADEKSDVRNRLDG
jgi:hypothetical protein